MSNESIMEIDLPHLGRREVKSIGNNHFLWRDPFGWHDCTRNEDEIIVATINKK